MGSHSYVYVWIDSDIQFLQIGQSYEIRMLDNRKMGDMPEISGKLVKVRTLPLVPSFSLVLAVAALWNASQQMEESLFLFVSLSFK